MTVNPLGQESVLGQVDSSQREHKEENLNTQASNESTDGLVASSDKVSISPEARQQLDTQKGEGKDGGQEKPAQTTAFTMGKSGNDEKEDAVDELEETNSDIKKKEDEIQEAKITFAGSEEEKAQKLKELKQDLDDLEDTKKELQSTLAS